MLINKESGEIEEQCEKLKAEHFDNHGPFLTHKIIKMDFSSDFILIKNWILKEEKTHNFFKSQL